MTSDVWPAAEHDIQSLIEMGKRFHRAGRLPGVFSPGVFGAFCAHLIDMDDGIIFRSERGMIGGHIAPLPWDCTYKVATEAFWWSEDHKGAALRSAYEEWALARADEIRMGCLTTLRFVATATLLSRRGYQAVEVGMVKT